MTTFLTGLFRRLTAATRPTIAGNPKPPVSQRTQKLAPQQHAAVDVKQEGNPILIDGIPDAGSLCIHREPGTGWQPHSDKIVIRWTEGGEQHSKSFTLYGTVERNGKYVVEQKIEFVEVSGGRGKHQFWSQTKITSYF